MIFFFLISDWKGFLISTGERFKLIPKQSADASQIRQDHIRGFIAFYVAVCPSVKPLYAGFIRQPQGILNITASLRRDVQPHFFPKLQLVKL